jgi:arabinose-5-phosphate isomerase
MCAQASDPYHIKMMFTRSHQDRPPHRSPGPATSIEHEDIKSWGAAAVRQEAVGLEQLADSLDGAFIAAVNEILRCEGRTIVAGMGKSGHIGKKIASTLASTGTPAMFVHPAEASHGDLGMIEKRDVVIALSKSGESPEFHDLLVYCRRFGIPVIAVTAKPESSLARAASIVLVVPLVEEACPLGLAPTTSTTMTLALGDALAVACLRARDFQPSQFREYHPGGKLGQKLTRVCDVMHGVDMLPLVPIDALLAAAVLEMSKGRFGCVGVLDPDGKLVGIFTDGDLRRHFSAANMERPVQDLMHPSPSQIDPDALIADVTYLFTEKRIPSVFACTDGKPVGILHVHDLLQRGFV